MWCQDEIDVGRWCLIDDHVSSLTARRMYKVNTGRGIAVVRYRVVRTCRKGERKGAS